MPAAPEEAGSQQPVGGERSIRLDGQILWQISTILDGYFRQFGQRLPWDWQSRLARGEYSDLVNLDDFLSE